MKLIFNAVAAYFLIIEWQLMIVSGFGLTNATDSVLSCTHNGTRFANGSFVPTVEPCLNCKCISANLICALRICPEQPFPPPRGCVIVQKRDSCCPYITCSKWHTTTKNQDKNVITHDRTWYEQNIKNRIFSQNALQRRIDETDDGSHIGNEKMCIHNGTVYRSGSAMTTSSLCSYCYCIGGKEKCVEPKCILPTKGCEPIFIDSSCCPIRYDCTPNKTIKAKYNTKTNRRRNGNKHYLRMTSRMQRSRGCLVQSTFYPEGHKLPANQTNPCEICFCIGGSKRCAPKKCAPMIKNCKPIIPDGQCCPSSYECNHRSKLATAREFSPRQYDFFSLLFGDESKENSTASWDYESETESTNTDLETNTTNEKGLLDAIKESLSHVDGTKKPIDPNGLLKSNGSSASNYSDVSDEDDEEEISILDFFLNGDTSFSSTTPSILTFDVTGKPLANGMTNSPMKIRPILPDQAANDSLKFAMLPVSLYNMVKDDGSIMFVGGKSTETPSTEPSVKLTDNLILDSKPSIAPQILKKTTSIPHTTVKVPVKVTHAPTVKPTKFEQKIVSSMKIESTTPNAMDRTADNALKHTSEKHTTTSSSTISAITVVVPVSSTKKPEKIKSTTVRVKSTNAPSTEIVTKIRSTQKTTTTSQKPPVRSTPVNLLTSGHFESTPKPQIWQTTHSTPVLTTAKTIHRTTSLPKINLNPSILESEINYDYSEPTLPPSLPNLKIIPFLPTDAVKNTVHKGDGFKSNFNYYQPSNSYSGQYVHTQANNNYSPFNTKPNSHDQYNANKADDRIDYDTYKPPPGNQDNIDYINIYAGGSNGIPQSIQMTVNSHLGYGSNDQKIPKIPPIPNKNLTVKPPLPPFEPEYEYDLYNRPPNVHLHPTNNYNEYNNVAQNTNDGFSSEHNYQVPHFVTMPPVESLNENHRESVFSFSAKNNFVPPVKTEGGFVPKRVPTIENYIPLHNDNFYLENVENTDYKASNQTENETDSKNVPPQINDEKNIISITTDTNSVLYSDPSIRSESNAELHQLLNELQPIPFEEYNHNVSHDEQMLTSITTTTTEPPTTSTPTTTTEFVQKPQQKNATNGQNTIPLKLITIVNNSKKENPTKVEIPQRKNNKIIDPTDEPFNDDTNTTEMPKSNKIHSENDENSSILRDVFLSSYNRPSISDVSDDLLHKSSIFLQRPINKLSPTFISSASFPGLTSTNTIESKHSYQSNPIRSELDLIIPELNKNKQSNEFSHTNNFSSENYQVLASDDTNISNTESYVVNPVDVDKLKQHQSHGETEIFTPPHKDPAGLFKLDGCNIYGRMYRVDRIIAELSSPCLECRCTEVGVACTPLNC